MDAEAKNKVHLVRQSSRPQSKEGSRPGHTESANMDSSQPAARAVSSEEFIAKLRDEVELGGQGASHVFIILGASVSALNFTPADTFAF